MAINSASGASLMCLRSSTIQLSASRARSRSVDAGISLATDSPYLVMVRLSPRPTRSSSLGKYLLASEAPIVSTIFPLRELGRRIYNKSGKPTESVSQLGPAKMLRTPAKMLWFAMVLCLREHIDRYADRRAGASRCWGGKIPGRSACARNDANRQGNSRGFRDKGRYIQTRIRSIQTGIRDIQTRIRNTYHQVDGRKWVCHPRPDDCPATCFFLRLQHQPNPKETAPSGQSDSVCCLPECQPVHGEEVGAGEKATQWALPEVPQPHRSERT